MMTDKFYIPGRVHQSEWDWRTRTAKLAKDWKKNPTAFIQFDAGKLFGLVSALDDALALSSCLSARCEGLKRDKEAITHHCVRLEAKLADLLSATEPVIAYSEGSSLDDLRKLAKATRNVKSGSEVTRAELADVIMDSGDVSVLKVVDNILKTCIIVKKVKEEK